MTTETVKATTTEEGLRRFPLEEGFMKDKSINGMLYAKLQNISYLNEETQKRYVYHSDISYSEWEKEEFKEVCSRQKLSRDFKKLERLGFVVEGLEGGQKVWYLPYNEAEFFQYVPNLTIDYLLKVKSTYATKIYIYLLDKYEWKKKEGGAQYRFTKKELNEAIGLTNQQKNNENVVDYCLNSLHNEGLLGYREILVPSNTKNKAPIHYFEIIEVRTKVKGLNYDGKRKKKGAKVGDITVLEEKSLTPIVEGQYYDWIEEAKEEAKEEIKMIMDDEYFKRKAFAQSKKTNKKFDF